MTPNRSRLYQYGTHLLLLTILACTFCATSCTSKECKESRECTSPTICVQGVCQTPPRIERPKFEAREEQRHEISHETTKEEPSSELSSFEKQSEKSDGGTHEGTTEPKREARAETQPERTLETLPESPCKVSETLCRGKCVDHKTNNAHCGTCGNACVFGKKCLKGTCQCPGAKEICENGVDDDCNGKIDDGCPAGEWARAWGGTSWDEGRSIAVDATGNVYITGYFMNPKGFFGSKTVPSKGVQDAFIAKISKQGQLIWLTTVGSALFEEGNAIKVDFAGNVYVHGRIQGFTPLSFGGQQVIPRGKDDAFVAKLDSKGSFVWVVGIGGSNIETTGDIAVDATGNVYVTGTSNSTFLQIGSRGSQGHNAKRNNIFIAKISDLGLTQWITFFGGNGNDSSHGLVVDRKNNIYITGSFEETAKTSDATSKITLTSTGKTDLFVAKLDNKGIFQWAASAGGKDKDEANSIVIDAKGNSYITGYFGLSATFGKHSLFATTQANIFVAKLDDKGTFQWASSANGNTHFEEQGNDLAIDPSGKLYVVGHYFQKASFGSINLHAKGQSGFLAILDNKGSFKKVLNIGKEGGSGSGIALDSSPYLYITGFFSSRIRLSTFTLTSAGGNDIFVARLLR